ncbi:unnamed protein product, partial [Ectocarpus sp. 12 AP-2014]
PSLSRHGKVSTPLAIVSRRGTTPPRCSAITTHNSLHARCRPHHPQSSLLWGNRHSPSAAVAQFHTAPRQRGNVNLHPIYTMNSLLCCVFRFSLPQHLTRRLASIVSGGEVQLPHGGCRRIR